MLGLGFREVRDWAEGLMSTPDKPRRRRMQRVQRVDVAWLEADVSKTCSGAA